MMQEVETIPSEESPLRLLSTFGQSPWLDFIQRELLRSGKLDAMIDEWGIRGVTSNPSIFEKAISHSNDYDEQIGKLVAAGHDANEIYDVLVLADCQEAADSLREVYDMASGHDGFVSLEVSPHLARDTAGTIAEARRFWRLLDRPNTMIKVPATREGLPAIRQLISEGINVNITLLFSLDRYAAVIDAWLSGLEDAIQAGRPVTSIASVASFFLSRIDTAVDEQLASMSAEDSTRASTAQGLCGKVALASARRAYLMFQEMAATPRFQALATDGAHPQRLLWASTGTKNPAYSDIKYVESLIGPNTVNTMPLETLRAYEDHGEPADRLTTDDSDSLGVLNALDEVDIDLQRVTDRLLEEGIRKFVEPYDALHQVLAGWPRNGVK